MWKKPIGLSNQRGTALVIALLVMVTATVIAIGASFTSTTEVAISGNQRQYTEAFFVADGGLELVKSYFLDNYTLFPESIGDQVRLEDVPDTSPFSRLGYTLKLDLTESKVTKIREGNPPKGRGISSVHFKGNYYLGKTVASNSVDLEEEFCLISPR
jgi:hypothetical protein